MKSSTLIMAAALLTFQVTMAGEKTERKLFTLEKSLNSENILLIHTQTDESCKFVTNENGYVDFYWLMDGLTKKPVHPMIRSKVQERVAFSGINATRDSFKVKLNDLSEIKHDLEDTNIEALAALKNGNCDVTSVIKLGASANYRKMNLKRTFCEVDKNLLGVPKGCKYLELQGTDADTGEALKVRFKGK
nr:DUF4833 domain-containing protein [Bacteriovorax sp. HI3]